MDRDLTSHVVQLVRTLGNHLELRFESASSTSAERFLMASKFGCMYGVSGWIGWKQSVRTLAKAAFSLPRPQLLAYR